MLWRQTKFPTEVLLGKLTVTFCTLLIVGESFWTSVYNILHQKFYIFSFSFTLAYIARSLTASSSSHLPDRHENSQWYCSSATFNFQIIQVSCKFMFLHALFALCNHIFNKRACRKTFTVNIMVFTVKFTAGIKNGTIVNSLCRNPSCHLPNFVPLKK